MLFLGRPLSNFPKFCQKSCHETDTLHDCTMNYPNNKYLMSIECIVTWSSQSSCRTNTELSQFKQRTYFLAGSTQPKPRPLLKQIKCSTANIFRKLLSPTNFFVWPKNESSIRQRNKIYSINTWVKFRETYGTLLLWRSKLRSGDPNSVPVAGMLTKPAQGRGLVW